MLNFARGLKGPRFEKNCLGKGGASKAAHTRGQEELVEEVEEVDQPTNALQMRVVGTFAWPPQCEPQ